MKKYNVLTLALVVALSLFVVYYAVEASSTIGTNLSTTGTLAVTGVTTLTAGASLSAGVEIVTYASISGNLQFGGSGTHTLGVNSGSGALTINAFTLGGAVTGPLNLTGAASASTNFEAGGYASASRIVVGGKVSSASTYTAQFQSSNPAASTSVLFGGGGASLGTCLQLKDQLGMNVYLRITSGATASGSTLSGGVPGKVLISTTSCR